MTVASAIATTTATKAGAGPDGPEWEEARAPVSSAAPVLRADGIEGPLDWILEQARAGRIDLARLPVAVLVEQCVAAVDAALAAGSAGAGDTGSARPKLERLADWVKMAAWLAWLRSGLLLPQGDPEAQAVRDEAEALRRRLAKRERVRAMAALLEARPQLGDDVFAPGARPEARQDLPALLRLCAAARPAAGAGGSGEHQLPDPAALDVAARAVRTRAVVGPIETLEIIRPSQLRLLRRAGFAGGVPSLHHGRQGQRCHRLRRGQHKLGAADRRPSRLSDGWRAKAFPRCPPVVGTPCRRFVASGYVRSRGFPAGRNGDRSERGGGRPYPAP